MRVPPLPYQSQDFFDLLSLQLINVASCRQISPLGGGHNDTLEDEHHRDGDKCQQAGGQLRRGQLAARGTASQGANRHCACLYGHCSCGCVGGFIGRLQCRGYIH